MADVRTPTGDSRRGSFPRGGVPVLLSALVLVSLLGLSRFVGRRPSPEEPGPNGPTLRVLVRSDPIAFLPRNADPVTLDREIAAGLAASLGRRLELVHEDDFSRMEERLLADEADLIAAGMTATEARRERMAFSLPYLHVDELLVMPKSKRRPESVDDLDGRHIAIRRATAYAETLQRLREKVPGIRVRWMPETSNAEDILDRLVAGEADGTILDSNMWHAVEGHYESLRAVLPLAQDRPIAVALRRGEAELRRGVNEFLIARALTEPREQVHTADLAGLVERRRLRMITRSDAATDFLHRGTELGFEYELLARFAKRHGLRLEIVIPPSRTELTSWLESGRGDVIAASLAIPADRRGSVAFTRSFATVDQVIVVRAAEAEHVQGPEDLTGRTIVVPDSSASRDSLLRLWEGKDSLDVVFTSEDLETEEILARVESGDFDVTVCHSNLLDLARNSGSELAAAYSLGEVQLGWAVRSENVELLQTLNDFLNGEVRGLEYNVIWNSYFERPEPIVRLDAEWRSDRTGRISPYDELARRYALVHDMDWRLLVAQMYVESRFDPDRVSLAGATGLMQIVPRTAEELGISDLHDPEDSIRGGAKYLRWLMDRLEPKLPLSTRLRFALASYNAGRGHVIDARRLARRIGLDPDRWYGHVEKALLLLERHEYFEPSRYGYCRGSECVRYVNEIDRIYRTYVGQVPDSPALQPVTTPSAPEDRDPVGTR
jgi:membrane-bound lytic murein transglycosylase F